jgi:hypothetical protein
VLRGEHFMAGAQVRAAEYGVLYGRLHFGLHGVSRYTATDGLCFEVEMAVFEVNFNVVKRSMCSGIRRPSTAKSGATRLFFRFDLSLYFQVDLLWWLRSVENLPCGLVTFPCK